MRAGRGPLFQCLAGAVFVLGFALVLAVSSIAIFWYRLGSGPIYFESLGPKIASALGDRLGGDFAVTVGPTIVGRGEHGPALAIDGLSVKSASGQVVLAAPKAEVDVDAIGLMFGNVTPARLELIGLELRLMVMPNGAIAISTGADPIVLTGPKEPTEKPSETPADGDAPGPVLTAQETAAPGELQLLAGALRALFDVATSPDSPVAALERFGVHEGRLVLDDQLRGRQKAFENLDLEVARKGDSAVLTLATNGSAGRWRISARAKGAPGEQRDLSIDVRDISLDDINSLSGQKLTPVDFDMPISLHLDFVLATDGKISAASGSAGLGAGYVYLKDPDAEPLQVDEINASVSWNAQDRRFDLREAQFLADQTRFSLVGWIAPGAAGEPWRFDLNGAPGNQFGGDRPGDAPIVINDFRLSGWTSPADRQLSVEYIRANGPLVSLAAALDVNWSDEAPSVKLNGTSGRMGAREVVRLWPSFVAAATRGWFIDHLRSGNVESGRIAIDFGREAFEAMRTDHPVPDSNLLIEFKLANGILGFLPGVPPLTGIEGVGKITGRSASFAGTKASIELARGRKLGIAELSFTVPDLEPARARGIVNGKVSGGLDAVADLLSRDALKTFGGLPVDANVAHGQADGRVTVDIKLNPKAAGEPTSVKVAANVTNFVMDHLVGKEKLDQGALTVAADKNGFHASGQGRLFGSPAAIDLKRQGTGAMESTITVTLDDAARAKQGWPSAPAVTGPVGLKFAADLSKPDISRAQVDVDLTKAAMDGMLPGYSKAAGRPAKASFVISADGDGARLDQFSFDGGGGVSVAGVVNLDSTGGVAGGRVSQVRLSPGDDMKVDLDMSRETMKVTVRAAAIDVRPFLKKAGHTDAPQKEAPNAREVDLDLKSTLLTGNNRQVIANADLRYIGKGLAVRQLSLNGRIGRSTVTGQLVRGAAAPIITVNTQDGGALLSFMDLYRRMEGGELEMTARAQGDRIDGTIHVLNFIVRDEPGLRRLVSEGAGGREGGPIDTTAVQFTKLQTAFSRTPTRLDLRDGVIYGAQIGLSVDGNIDYGRDRVLLNGTFVPAYGLNNLFSQIPLFGPIIGGGSHEGLFAVNFQVSGAASAPVLNINPLSAIAPGFLRKIFGAGIPRSPSPPAPIPQTAPPMPMTIGPGR